MKGEMYGGRVATSLLALFLLLSDITDGLRQVMKILILIILLGTFWTNLLFQH